MKYLILIFIILISSLNAQTIINGKIEDALTGKPLEAANIQITGSFRGTISNQDGEFSLGLTQIPSEVVISFIGYASNKTMINKIPDEPVIIKLQPIMLQMEPIVVVAEDPAVGIMKEVIKRKKIWREKLNTYKAHAYTRLSMETDSSIALITETISEAYWDKKRGPREIIKSKRQTENIANIKDLIVGASYITNFYDDDIEIQGFNVIGPTHPDALKHYNFKLLKEDRLDKKVVYKISVEPDSKLQPLMEGVVWVLDEDYALIKVNLKPSDNMVFPFPIQKYDLTYKQQFSNFGQEFWLPVDVRVKGTIKIGLVGLNFPEISYNQISQINDYNVNIVVPDSLYKEKKIFIKDSVSLAKKGLFDSTENIIPLSYREEKAYEELDSTQTLDKKIKPTGFLARYAQVSIGGSEASVGNENDRSWKFGPELWYNRVDGGFLGVNYNQRIGKKTAGQFNLGYGLANEKFSYGGNFTYYFSKRSIDENNETRLNLFYKNSTDTRFNSHNYPMVITSLMPLLGERDYFDYFRNERTKISLHHNWDKINTNFTVSLNYEKHSSLDKNTDYNILKRDITQRENPAINEGELKSVKASVTFYEEPVPWGIVGTSGIKFDMEYAPEQLNDDFSFSRFEFAAYARVNTFLKRRIFPNSLDVILRAGTYTGELPLQRLFIIDSRLTSFAPFGTFKTIGEKPIEGEKYVSFFWEHNFRSVPFELIGLSWFAKKGTEILINGGSGRTWFSKDYLAGLEYNPGYINKYHHEMGISVNKIFNLIRLDYTRSLTKDDYFISIGMARFF